MEHFYLAIVIILILLAVSDLIVGVGNDAVNFLNSAIGSKAAPLKVIMIIAAVGIVVGATFSSGMMEVARKGIFNPEKFYFSDIMIIFLAVMMTDIILLDVYNTFGLPTSTTVSIVFELLGAAVAISIIKITGSHLVGESVGDYINSSRALLIIAGILLSIVIAFTVGAIVQYITRLIFTFNYEKSYKYFGAIWGGIAISAITYFILIKGAKGSSFITKETLSWIQANTFTILLYSFIGWTIILQLLMWLFKLNILKMIVLVGTFALAMAFAGNDLVNFIGVPLAGLESYKDFIASGATDAGSFSMEALQGKVKTPTEFLIIAGIIMVITLWLSKKARTVSKTELNLSRQDEGDERFGSSMLARTLVRESISFSSLFGKILPSGISKRINKRFDKKIGKKRKKEASSFDLVRASVNLVVAAILISIGTANKLPLSTTYVTFMVSMGTSLADRAWNRESAVYRITGVITVIGGWFLTAFSAFTVAFLVAYFISWGNIYAIGILIIITIFLLIKTHAHHKKQEARSNIEAEAFEVIISDSKIVEKCSKEVISFIITLDNIYDDILTGLFKEKRKILKNLKPKLKENNKNIKSLKKSAHSTIVELKEELIDTGHCYIQNLEYMHEIHKNLKDIWESVFNHVDNNHSPLLSLQINDLKKLKSAFSTQLMKINKVIEDNNYKKIDDLRSRAVEIENIINLLIKKQLKLIKKEMIGTRNSLLTLEILNGTKNMNLLIVNIVQTQCDFLHK